MKIKKSMYNFYLFLKQNEIKMTIKLVDSLNHPMIWYDGQYTSSYPDNWDDKIIKLYKRYKRIKNYKEIRLDEDY